jgi:hypothetical protein
VSVAWKRSSRTPAAVTPKTTDVRRSWNVSKATRMCSADVTLSRRASGAWMARLLRLDIRAPM